MSTTCPLEMPADLKAKWLKALRSGNYKQAHGTLLQDEPTAPEYGGYCCLGVLQMIVDGEVERHGEGDMYHDEDQVQLQPTDQWYKRNGMKSFLTQGPYGAVYGGETRAHNLLIEMNDGFTKFVDSIPHRIEGASFTVIADYIEQNVKGV